MQSRKYLKIRSKLDVVDVDEVVEMLKEWHCQEFCFGEWRGLKVYQFKGRLYHLVHDYENEIEEVRIWLFMEVFDDVYDELNY